MPLATVLLQCEIVVYCISLSFAAGRTMGKIFGAACLLLAMAGSAGASNCSVPTIRTLDNQTVDGYMTVKSGTRCFI
jgi:hypothetical protein